MRTKRILNAARLVFSAWAILALVHCAKEEEENMGPTSDEVAVMQAVGRLEITYSAGNSVSRVTGDITLPAEGANGVVITWGSSDAGIIGTDGVVSVPDDMSRMVTLTATLRKGDAMSSKTFALTVLHDDPNLINIENVAQLIAMRYDSDGNGMVDADEDDMVDETNQSIYQAAFTIPDGTTWEGYELRRDFTLSENWTPQPNIATNFEGNGFTISNMTILRSAMRNNNIGKQSFFGDIDAGGHVRNLTLRDADVDGTNHAGVLAGENNGTITGCSATGTLTVTEWYNGGFVGLNTGTITSSYAEVTVTSRRDENGGLVGRNTGTITASYATGDVTTSGRSAGGLVGENHNGTVTASYATGDVTGDRVHVHRNRHGGLVGFNRGSEATITASYATGNVNGNDHSIVGGLVGENEGVITTSYATGMVTSMGNEAGGLVGKNDGMITASYATGMVASTGNEAGGLVGENENEGVITASYAAGMVASTGNEVGGLVGKNDGMITASYFDSTTSGITEGTGAKSTFEIRAPTAYGADTDIYAGWNIDVDSDGTTGFVRGVDDGSMAGDTEADDPWDFGMNDQYPALKVDFDGDGTATWEEFGSQR